VGLLNLVAPTVWSRDWVVHSQAAGDGQQSLRYLAPYVFRVAISNHRIVSCDDGKVTFAYRRVGSNRPRKMTLDAMEFLRRFLQHVLPAGFQKVRHYGFLSPNSATAIEAVRWPDHFAQRGRVHVAGRARRGARSEARAALPRVRRLDGRPGIRAGPGAGRLRHELAR